MGLSDDEQLEILLERLRKYKYSIDEKERFHLMSLIRRGVLKIERTPKERPSGDRDYSSDNETY